MQFELQQDSHSPPPRDPVPLWTGGVYYLAVFVARTSLCRSRVGVHHMQGNSCSLAGHDHPRCDLEAVSPGKGCPSSQHDAQRTPLRQISSQPRASGRLADAGGCAGGVQGSPPRGSACAAERSDSSGDCGRRVSAVAAFADGAAVKRSSAPRSLAGLAGHPTAANQGDARECGGQRVLRVSSGPRSPASDPNGSEAASDISFAALAHDASRVLESLVAVRRTASARRALNRHLRCSSRLLRERAASSPQHRLHAAPQGGVADTAASPGGALPGENTPGSAGRPLSRAGVLAASGKLDVPDQLAGSLGPHLALGAGATPGSGGAAGDGTGARRKRARTAAAAHGETPQRWPGPWREPWPPGLGAALSAVASTPGDNRSGGAESPAGAAPPGALDESEARTLPGMRQPPWGCWSGPSATPAGARGGDLGAAPQSPDESGASPVRALRLSPCGPRALGGGPDGAAEPGRPGAGSGAAPGPGAAADSVKGGGCQAESRTPRAGTGGSPGGGRRAAAHARQGRLLALCASSSDEEAMCGRAVGVAMAPWAVGAAAPARAAAAARALARARALRSDRARLGARVQVHPWGMSRALLSQWPFGPRSAQIPDRFLISSWHWPGACCKLAFCRRFLCQPAHQGGAMPIAGHGRGAPRPP